MDSKHRYSLGERISTVATTLTIWWHSLVIAGARGTVFLTASAKFILPMYSFLAVVPVYALFVPFQLWWLYAPYAAALVYYGRFKLIHLYHRTFRQQLTIHAQMWMAWTHALATLRHSKHTSYHEFLTMTLTDTLFPLETLSQCRGQLYGMLWYCALITCVTTHAVHLYWTLTWKVQMVPTVKKYQMLPPAPKINKRK